MTFDPSAVWLCALVIVGTLLTAEAYLTWRGWWRDWRASRLSRSTCPVRATEQQAVRWTSCAVRRPSSDDDEQSPYGKGNSLVA
jgi:hypothetical protein